MGSLCPRIIVVLVSVFKFLTAEKPSGMAKSKKIKFKSIILVIYSWLKLCIRCEQVTPPVGQKYRRNTVKSHHIYCLSCQQGKTMLGATPIVMKNGSLAVKGKCPKCNNVSYRIVRKDELKAPQYSLRLILLYISLALVSGLSMGIVLTRLLG
jgi:hypothetical protein